MEKSVRFWDRVAGGREFDKGGAAYLKTIEKAAGYLTPGASVLDFGCGPGSRTLDLAKSAGRVHGIDTSPRMIATAQEHAGAQGATNVGFSCMSLFDERLKTGTFDVVMAFDVLLYLDDLRAHLSRIGTLLKPGGVFLSSTGCLAERFSVAGGLVFVLNKLKIMPPTRFFRTNELQASIQDGGFAVVETDVSAQSTSDLFVAARKA
jgi:2-polyprenyl-3-methyl-5-hydroxy-6-metoxy-1,4-benzoquinol methylase